MLDGSSSVRRRLATLATSFALMVGLIPGGGASAATGDPVLLNEILASTTGTDVEFIELYGTPGASLSGLSLVVVEGATGTSQGNFDRRLDFGAGDAIGANGFFLIGNGLVTTTYGVTPNLGIADNYLENSSFTIALVETSSITGTSVSGGEVVKDSLALSDGSPGDVFYFGAPVFGPDGTFFPAGAERITDGVDTDTAADWELANFNLGPDNTPTAGTEIATVPELGDCGDPATFIHEIQGSGATSPMTGDTVVVEGIVVGDFQNNAAPDSGELRGFFLQEEDADVDGDEATSEGLFVFLSSTPDVSAGDRVRVLAEVVEFGSSGSQMTELSGVEDLEICASGLALPTAKVLTLPVGSLDEFEAVEGMLVTFPQALYISEYFNFDRFNEIVLTAERQFQPTAVYEPGSPEADALAEANSLGRITLDDGRSAQNQDPAIHPNGEEFTLDNRFRGGDTVQNVIGVMEDSFGLYRIHPIDGADYASENPRPSEPEDVGGSLTVASFNVLNYFTTLDDGVNDICGPEADQECRGADTMEEFERQRAKIIAALSDMDADVVGLIEIENNIGDGPTADLVSGLNDAMGAGTYAYIETGAIGTDAIRVALIYKPASVSPVGDYAILDSTVDPRFDDDRNRPVLAQSFEETDSGAVFTVAVNHLKSKGSACGAGDDDPQQGNCNVTRTNAAEALVDWLATDPTNSGDRDVLIMGDLNSYDKEDPIDEVAEGSDDALGTGDDYTDLVHAYQGEFAYSYVFDGQLGYLDHALASQTMASQVTGATIWHINADEPDIIDYDTSFKQDAQDALYEPNAYRSSDHDPVIVGLDLLAFDFGGFGPPVGEPAATSSVKAGRTVPVSFSLGGDFGLDVLFEQPQVFLCDDWPLGPSVDAASPGGTTLSYDPVDDEYSFPWKTRKAWAGSCRTLELTFIDGTYVTASFEMR